jgi:hypothetical protein
VTIEGELPGGGRLSVTCRVAAIVPWLVMKGMALEDRLKVKHAYDTTTPRTCTRAGQRALWRSSARTSGTRSCGNGSRRFAPSSGPRGGRTQEGEAAHAVGDELHGALAGEGADRVQRRGHVVRAPVLGIRPGRRLLARPVPAELPHPAVEPLASQVLRQRGADLAVREEPVGEEHRDVVLDRPGVPRTPTSSP